jgi:tetratricopeptide (TPR) repeat protein
MHDLLRLYADQLSDAHADVDEREQARDRLLRYCLDTARAADARLRALPDTPVPAEFSGRESALAWLDAERPSLIAAVSMADSTGREQIAMRLPLNLAEYLLLRRRLDDWLAATRISLNAARHRGDRGNEAAALDNLGIALREVGQFEKAITKHQDAMTIFRETGDRPGEGTALKNLGTALREAGRFEDAITACRDAIAIFRETRRGESRAQGSLGVALRKLGRFDDAIAAFQADREICREIGDRHGEGMTLNHLGDALREADRKEEAITAHQDAAAIFRETGDRRHEGAALDNLGVALREAGRKEEAITAHQDAAAIFRETGDPHGEETALNNLKLDHAAHRT